MKKRNVFFWFKWLILLLLSLRLLAYFGLLVAISNTFIAPHNQPICCDTPADEGWAYETISFTSEDGNTLYGWYIPSGSKTAVILLHGHDGDRTQMLSRADMLARNGYGVLLYDLRGHGESVSKSRSLGWEDVVDVEAAVAYLQQRDDVDPSKIGLVGFSLGGQIALRAAQLAGIQAVAADGPGFANAKDFPPPHSVSDYLRNLDGWLWLQAFEYQSGLTPPTAVVDQIANISPKPILLIGVGDEVPLAEVYYEAASEPKTLWEIPEAAHGQGPFVRPQEYEERLITFFNNALQ